MSTDRRALITREVLAAIRLGEDSGYDFTAVCAKTNRVFEYTERSEGGQPDAFDAMGTLDGQIDQAMNRLQRRISTPAEKQPWRMEHASYDSSVLFKAIVNTVVHRDYSIHGSRIRLHLFPDRLELYVPGALANTLTVDALDARQYVRNDLIAPTRPRDGARCAKFWRAPLLRTPGRWRSDDSCPQPCAMRWWRKRSCG